MSGGNRRVILATIGGLAAFAVILAATGYGYYRFNEATEDPNAAERYQPARDARLPQPRPKQQPQPRAYQPNCQQPQTHEDSDLCAQWDSVKAISETNRLTRLALSLAALGFVFAVFGALISLIGTGLIWLAWRETRVANRIARRDFGRARVEARKASKIAEQQLALAERPHMLWTSASIGSLKELPLEDDLSLVFHFSNHGNGPAWMQEYACGGWTIAPNVPFLVNEATMSRTEISWQVHPNGGGWEVQAHPVNLSIPAPTKALVASGDLQLFVALKIIYDDAGGREHVNKIVLTYEGATDRLVPALNPYNFYS